MYNHFSCVLIFMEQIYFITKMIYISGCGTKQDPLRVFTNNVVVRFHPGLEMDGDEVITIVCRYPPPVAPAPPKPPESM